MRFGVMPEKGTLVSVPMSRWLQEWYSTEGKVICFVDLVTVFDTVLRKMLEKEINSRCFGWSIGDSL